MNPTVALPGSMTWMEIRLSSGSRSPQSPKTFHRTYSIGFYSHGPVVVEWPEMPCAWSSQYPHRPIPPDQSRIVDRPRAWWLTQAYEFACGQNIQPISER